MILIFLKWIRLILCPSVWSLLGDALCEVGEGVCLPLLGAMLCVCLPCCFSPVSLLNFCPADPSLTGSELHLLLSLHHYLCLPSVLPMLLPVIRNYVLCGYIFTIVLSS